MKKITKARIKQQVAALDQLSTIPLPDDIAKQLTDIKGLLTDIHSVIEPKNKFAAAATLFQSLGYLTAQQAKQALDSAADYDR